MLRVRRSSRPPRPVARPVAAQVLPFGRAHIHYREINRRLGRSAPDSGEAGPESRCRLHFVDDANGTRRADVGNDCRIELTSMSIAAMRWRCPSGADGVEVVRCSGVFGVTSGGEEVETSRSVSVSYTVGSAWVGNSAVTVVPDPSVLSARTRPPWASMSSLTIASPRPVPPLIPRPAWINAIETLEHPARCSDGIPGTRVAHAQLDGTGGVARAKIVTLPDGV